MKQETKPPETHPVDRATLEQPPKTQSAASSDNKPEGSATPRKRRRDRGAPITEPMRDQIQRLHPHYGSREIGRRVGLSRKLVRRVLREMGLVPASERTSDQTKLESFQQAIQMRVDKDLTTTRILREIRALGYKGGRTILGKHVSALRAQQGLKPTRTVKRRFETGPGREMQIDWSPYLLSIAGRMVAVHALGCLLCASRKLYLRLFRDERQSTLLEGLACAFEYFQGVTVKLVLDNMATAVLGRFGPDRKVLWHPRFLDFTRHYGFEPFACMPRDPNRKGKKEKSFRLVYDDFLKGTELESWDDLDARRKIWLDETPEVGNQRVHGTTRRVVNEAWRQEQPFLIQLPDKRFAVHEDSVRLVDADSTLSMRGTRYTVPSALAGRSVAVRIYAEHFEVLDPQGRIAFSRTYVSDEDKGRLQIDKTHYAAVARRPHVPGGERLDEALVQRFASLGPLVQGLRLRFKALAPIQYRMLIRLADRYGQDAFLQAALRAQQYRRFDALAVERILAHDQPLPEHDSPAPLTGLGPVVLGEVEPGSLETYSHLDAAPAAPTDPVPAAAERDATTPATTPDTSPSSKEQDHGA